MSAESERHERRAQMWAVFAQAALAGYTATESEQYPLGSAQDIASVAANRADEMMEQFERRWGKK